LPAHRRHSTKRQHTPEPRDTLLTSRPAILGQKTHKGALSRWQPTPASGDAKHVDSAGVHLGGAATAGHRAHATDVDVRVSQDLTQTGQLTGLVIEVDGDVSGHAPMIVLAGNARQRGMAQA
jgi:hypothetical protein